jgi:acyl carrier protein
VSDEEKIRAVVREILGGIAPEADLTGLRPDANFRRELDLDSVDFQTFIIRLSQALQAHIPDHDSGRLSTLAACVAYFGRG